MREAVLVKGHGLAEKVQTPKMTNPHNKVAFSLLRMLLKGALYIILRLTTLTYIPSHPLSALCSKNQTARSTEVDSKSNSMTADDSELHVMNQGDSG